MEEINQATKSSQTFNLSLSSKGDLNVQTTQIDNETLQQILDASNVKQRIFSEHQTKLKIESDRTSLYVGIIFAYLVGVLAFCSLNTQKTSTQSYLQGIQNNA